MGQVIADKVIDHFQHILENKVTHFIPSPDLLAIHNLLGDDFVIYFAPKSKPSAHQLYELAMALGIEIKNQLNCQLTGVIQSPLDLHIGHSLAAPSSIQTENQISRAVKAAYRMAKDVPDQQSQKLIADLREILDKKDLQIIYQPIVSLKTGQILGWEALTRGPKDSFFIIRELAITQAGDLSPDNLLFLNLNPQTINDPEFIRGETKNFLLTKGLRPENIVFEITKQSSIQDFYTFKRSLEHYRSQGYLVAVDDAGAGYSSLQSIAEIHPAKSLLPFEFPIWRLPLL